MIKKLEWDSNFWGKNIFNIDTDADIDIDSKLPMIQYLIPCSDVTQVKAACSKGFEFIQGKITLKKDIKKAVDIELENFKPLSLDDLNANKDSFFSLYGAHSRHKMFSKEKINDYYYSWLKNSINGQLDDECIGCYAKDEAAGFISYKKADNNLVIGLVGVFPKFQRLGISQKLLDYALNYAHKNNCRTILVATQDSNINAINAYIKYGYSICSIEHWYYKINF